MPITTPTFAYDFDPHGQLAANKIQGEQHVITATQERAYQKVVPRWAPFFRNSLVVRYVSPQNQSRVLVEGQDYYVGHQFLSATRACAQPIYGSINILDPSLQGTIVIDKYQTLGGMWTVDANKIAEILADQLYNPRVISWEAVTDQPISFPVVDHEWDIVDMKGAGHVVSAILAIRDAVSETGDSGLRDHLADTNNPHGTTKAQVGLGNVPNYPMATSQSAKTGLATNEFMSPSLTREAIQEQVLNALNEHKADHNNPHAVTPAIIGAPSNTQFTSGLATKLGRTEASVDTQLFNGLTLAQITAQILQGTAANSVLFNGQTFAQVTNQILQGTAYNSDRFAGLTLAQFDLYIEDYISNMTGLEVTATDTVRFAGRTFAQAMAEILLGTSADSNRFSGMTLAEFDAHIATMISTMPVLPGTASNSQRLEGNTLNEVLAMTALQTSQNSNALEGQSLSQILNTVSGMTVEGANKLGGLALEQIPGYVIENAIFTNRQSVTYATSYAGDGQTNQYLHFADSMMPDLTDNEARNHGARYVDVYLTHHNGATGVVQYDGHIRITVLGRLAYAVVIKAFPGLEKIRWSIPPGDEHSRLDEAGVKWQRISFFAELSIGSVNILALAHGGSVDIGNVGATIPLNAIDTPNFPLTYWEDTQGSGLRRTVVTGALNTSASETIPVEDAQDRIIQLFVQLQGQGDPDEWFSGDATLSLVRNAADIFITNEHGSNINYRIIII